MSFQKTLLTKVVSVKTYKVFPFNLGYFSFYLDDYSSQQSFHPHILKKR